MVPIALQHHGLWRGVFFVWGKGLLKTHTNDQRHCIMPPNSHDLILKWYLLIKQPFGVY